jgi:hypothetical protein
VADQRAAVTRIKVSDLSARADGSYRVAVQFDHMDGYRAQVELEISQTTHQGSSVITKMTVRTLRPWRQPLGQELLKKIPQLARDLAFNALASRSEPSRSLAVAAKAPFKSGSRDSKGYRERPDDLTFAKAVGEEVGDERGLTLAQVRSRLKTSGRREFIYEHRTLTNRLEKSVALGLLDANFRPTRRLRSALGSRADGSRGSAS